MNRLVCPRDKIDLGNLFFEGEERSSRTQGGVRGAPHQRNLVRPSTRLPVRASRMRQVVVCLFLLLLFQNACLSWVAVRLQKN